MVIQGLGTNYRSKIFKFGRFKTVLCQNFWPKSAIPAVHFDTSGHHPSCLWIAIYIGRGCEWLQNFSLFTNEDDHHKEQWFLDYSSNTSFISRVYIGRAKISTENVRPLRPLDHPIWLICFNVLRKSKSRVDICWFNKQVDIEHTSKKRVMWRWWLFWPKKWRKKCVNLDKIWPKNCLTWPTIAKIWPENGLKYP